MLDWARQTQQVLRDISAAFGEITIPRVKPLGSTSSPTVVYQSLALVDATEDGTKKIRVVYGVVAGEPPDGFSEGDEPPYKLTVTATGFIWAGISIDDTTGEVTSRWVDKGAELPEDTATEFHIEIGSFNLDEDVLTIAQARYGPIDVQICRNWYAAEAPFFGVNWV
jgi:hypothetical protein